MLRLLASLLAGSLFGVGLMISGMTDTNKVQGWLDVFGAWDPTLAFVMGGAIIPMFFAWRFAARREKAMLGSIMPSKPTVTLDGKLIGGSIMFGMGWAIAGLCPGPAMASLSFGGTPGIVFFVALLAGMLLRSLTLSGAQKDAQA